MRVWGHNNHNLLLMRVAALCCIGWLLLRIVGTLYANLFFFKTLLRNVVTSSKTYNIIFRCHQNCLYFKGCITILVTKVRKFYGKQSKGFAVVLYHRPWLFLLEQGKQKWKKFFCWAIITAYIQWKPKAIWLANNAMLRKPTTPSSSATSLASGYLSFAAHTLCSSGG